MVQEEFDSVGLVDLVELLLLSSLSMLFHACHDSIVVPDKVPDEDAPERGDALINGVGGIWVSCMFLGHLWLELSFLKNTQLLFLKVVIQGTCTQDETLVCSSNQGIYLWRKR